MLCLYLGTDRPIREPQGIVVSATVPPSVLTASLAWLSGFVVEKGGLAFSKVAGALAL